MTEQEMAAALREKGWGLVSPDQYRIDMEPEFIRLWKRVEAFTMTGTERGYALYKAVEYLEKNRIAGDFVECGVWKGGSCMLMALALQQMTGANRDLYLYDTFTGMTEPTEEDVIAWNNLRVLKKWDEQVSGVKDHFGSWIAGLEEVKENMASTDYPADRLRYVAGDICETLDETLPGDIALLRLDTDWYQSTVKELEILYPKLVPGGILIIDDYGHFKGARQAVDEYFLDLGFFPYLSRVDYTGRVYVKPSAAVTA